MPPLTPTSRATGAYFLAILVLLGGLRGLASLLNNENLAEQSKKVSSSARSIAQENNYAEFSWDMVRHGIHDLLNLHPPSILL